MTKKKAQDTPEVSGEKIEATPTPPTITGLNANEVRALLGREVQGVVDSQFEKAFGGITNWRANIEKQVGAFDTAVAQLAEAGLLKEGADVGNLRSKVVGEAVSAPIGSNEEPQTPITQVPTTQTPEPSQPQATDPIYVAANVIAQQYGLTKDDPEAAMLVLDKGPVEYLESVTTAGKARATRTGQMGDNLGDGVEQIVPTDLSAGHVSRKNPIEDINDPATLLEMGLYPEKSGK